MNHVTFFSIKWLADTKSVFQLLYGEFWVSTRTKCTLYRYYRIIYLYNKPRAFEIILCGIEVVETLMTICHHVRDCQAEVKKFCWPYYSKKDPFEHISLDISEFWQPPWSHIHLFTEILNQIKQFFNIW